LELIPPFCLCNKPAEWRWPLNSRVCIILKNAFFRPAPPPLAGNVIEIAADIGDFDQEAPVIQLAIIWTSVSVWMGEHSSTQWIFCLKKHKPNCSFEYGSDNACKNTLNLVFFKRRIHS